MDMLNDFSSLQFPSTHSYGIVAEQSTFDMGTQEVELPSLPSMEVDDFTTPGSVASYVGNSTASPIPSHGTPSARRPPFEAITQQMVTPDSRQLYDAASSFIPADSAPGTCLFAGGELDRIRAARAMMQQETESRRPEYLHRNSLSIAAVGPNAGIAESPMKGRRIELFGFTETSEESFEERLMAGGYVGYGSTRGATDPPTTPVKSLNELLATSAPAATIKPEDSEDVDETVLDERARRKRRRLQAFKSGRPKSKALLHPVELDGTGRVLIDLFVPEKVEPNEQPETPKRKGGRRRKPRPKGARAPPGHAPTGEPGLHWPDEKFPWSVRTSERKEVERMEEADNLKWVAVYLDSDASEDEDDEEPVLPLPSHIMSFDIPPLPFPPGRGRGKSIPQPEAARRNVIIPSDPADARAALLAKGSVRKLLMARREEVMSICICGSGDDGRYQVQCDDCQRWYHLQCLGIGSPDDLGPEEQSWFCYACVDDGRGRALPRHHEEPTFVNDDRGAYTSKRDDPLFYDGVSYARSPTPSASHPPTTPTPRRDPPTRAGSYAEPRTPTPSHRDADSRVRVYETPTVSQEGIFDPSSTPSRGIRQKEGSGTWDRARYGGPFTPYAGGAPAANHGAYTTPTGRAAPLTTPNTRATMSLPRYARFSGQYVPASAGYDDTPINHSAARPAAVRSTRAAVESPSTGRESRRVDVVDEGLPSLRPA
ncbi:hypothetical protein K488DRAFT_74048 [Vararia minispora EC-137]|uniref:Uncharacterized protein n=1 Tax=Vararia minispora EC-137 TaxID=1314806 RepID=A0ACB8Q8T5_9AGAM|nr:hypothetical protein K488DRAFT_74048 [Vararia minispora EC-137]